VCVYLKESVLYPFRA